MGNAFEKSGLFGKAADVFRPFKAAFEGKAGAGKSFTMARLAIGIWQAEEEKPTVVLQDVERASKFFVPIFAELGLTEGKNFFVSQSRSLVETRKLLELCEKEHAIFLIDGVSTLSDQFIKEYCAKKKGNKWIEGPQDWARIKPQWRERFSEPIVESQGCHILFTGRAQDEYSYEENEETGKREFYKSGVKMRGDSELNYEPDFVVLMQRHERMLPGNNVKPYRTGTVLKSRYAPLDGQMFENPTFKDFEDAYRFVVGGGNPDPVLQTSMTAFFASGSFDYMDRRRKAEIVLENISGALGTAFPVANSADQKVYRQEILKAVFNSYSWTEISSLRPDILEEARPKVEAIIKAIRGAESAPGSKETDKIPAFVADLAGKVVIETLAAELPESKADEIPY